MPSSVIQYNFKYTIFFKQSNFSSFRTSLYFNNNAVSALFNHKRIFQYRKLDDRFHAINFYTIKYEDFKYIDIHIFLFLIIYFLLR